MEIMTMTTTMTNPIENRMKVSWRIREHRELSAAAATMEMTTMTTTVIITTTNPMVIRLRTAWWSRGNCLLCEVVASM